MKDFVRYAGLLAAMIITTHCAFAQVNSRPGGPPSSGGRGPGGPGGPGGPANPGGSANPGGPGSNPPAGSGNAPGNGSGNPGGAPGPNRNALQIGPAGRWWDDKSVARTVGLRGEQQKKMDVIFDSNKSAIVASYKTLLAEQDKLAVLNKSAQPGQAAVFAQIDSVNQARAALQKATTQMLLQIRSQLDTEQVGKLEQIH